LHGEKIISEKIVMNLGCIGEQEVKLPTSLGCIDEQETRFPTSLLHKNSLNINTNQKLLTINDVSRETGVPATTIRYWDKVGLISAQRCTVNNYRMFTAEHIRQILIIYALKFSVYANRQKHSIERIRKDLKEFDYNDKNRIEMILNNYYFLKSNSTV
jgi:hypothetical protein